MPVHSLEHEAVEMQPKCLMKLRSQAILAIVLVICPTQLGLALDQSNENAIAGLVIAGWKDWASRLVSGRFRAIGRVQIRGSPEDGELAGDVKLRCAFDYLNGRYRFDREQPFPVAAIVRTPEGHVIRDDKPPLKSEVRQQRYSRTNERSMYWAKGGEFDDESTIQIFAPDRAPRSEVSPLDIRLLGVVTFTEFENGHPELGGKMLDNVDQFLHKNKVEKVARHSDGLTEVVWRMHYSDRGRMIAWFDEAKGFVPVRSEIWHRFGDSIEFNNLLGRQEIHWTTKDGIAVPDSCVVESLQGKERYQRHSLRFEWESVNMPIQKSVFDVKADIPDELTTVFDHSLGNPILVQAPGLNLAPQKSAPPSSSSWGKQVILVTLTTCAVALLWVFVRARLKRP